MVILCLEYSLPPPSTIQDSRTIRFHFPTEILVQRTKCLHTAIKQGIDSSLAMTTQT